MLSDQSNYKHVTQLFNLEATALRRVVKNYLRGELVRHFQFGTIAILPKKKYSWAKQNFIIILIVVNVSIIFFLLLATYRQFGV